MHAGAGHLQVTRIPPGFYFTPRKELHIFSPCPPRARCKLLCSTSPPSTEQAESTSTNTPSGKEAAAKLEQTRRLVAEFGTASIPHPEKATYGGEDAFFTSPVGGGAFGVADGVGGWQESGINPADQAQYHAKSWKVGNPKERSDLVEYSRTFMRLACAFLEGKEISKVSVGEVQSGPSTDASLDDLPQAQSADLIDATARLTPQAALKAAHEGTRLPGSTTACVMRLDRDKRTLSAANVGDSGFLILRNGSVTFRSPPLQHFFDCPLQFAAYPDFTSATDNAEDAGLYDIPVQVGDLIVAGTDGLWDNVHQDEIIDILQQNASDIQQAATALARAASEHAHDRKFTSPYSQEARKQGIDIPWILRIATASFSDGKFKLGHMKGGKLDDITVVTALLKEVDSQLPQPTEETPVETPTDESPSPAP